jgi:RimJ/RimL family protein N-acetyltransferase
MPLTYLGRYIWTGFTSNNLPFTICLLNSKLQASFEEYLALLPLGSGYPVNSILSSSDRRSSEYRLSKNQFLALINTERPDFPIVAGSLSFHPGNVHDYHLRHGCRIHIYLLEQYRGIALGTFLLQAFEMWARKHGFLRLSAGTLASNIVSVKLFLKQGFKIEGRTYRAVIIRQASSEGEKEYFVDAVLLGKWIGSDGVDFPHQFST